MRATLCSTVERGIPVVAAACVTTNSRVTFHLNFSRDWVRGLSTRRVFVNLHEPFARGTHVPWPKRSGSDGHIRLTDLHAFP